MYYAYYIKVFGGTSLILLCLLIVFCGFKEELVLKKMIVKNISLDCQ